LADTGIKIESVVGSYGGRVDFCAEDLEFRPGQASVIVGPSGSGKTTMLRSLAGLVVPSVWRATPAWETVAMNASLVSQEPFLFKDTLRNNLIYGLGEGVSDETIFEVLK